MSGSDRRDYFRDLYELGSDADATLEEKIDRAITIGRDRLGVPYGVLSYTGDGAYEIVDSTLEQGQFTPGSVHELDHTLCRHVVASGDTLVIPDVDASAYADDAAREATDLRCYIGAPILVDGDVYGTLCFSGEEPQPDAFDEDDARFVELLARWIGYEIEREGHYDALNTQNDRLNEFAGVLAHDLRNPLAAAQGYTELAAETTDPPASDHLETVLESLDRMETLISETLSLAREGLDVGEREPVQLSTVATDAWETVAPAAADLEITTDRTLHADRTRLRQLFENLFANVDEHCGPDVQVTVEGTADGFAVADTGPGLPEDIAASLFGGDYGEGRRGIGLLILERIVSGHGWDATVETSEAGTRFVFSGVATAPGQPDPAPPN
jgi:signal transduction histidine kinase